MFKYSVYEFQDKVGREIPVAEIPSGNYCPGKYSIFCPKWEILGNMKFKHYFCKIILHVPLNLS